MEQIVNDVHSRLNATRGLEIVRPAGIDDVRGAILRVKQEDPRRGRLAICGGRHAMGGQQFGSDGLLLDMTGMNRAIALDEERVPGRRCSARNRSGAPHPAVAVAGPEPRADRGGRHPHVVAEGGGADLQVAQGDRHVPTAPLSTGHELNSCTYA